MKIILSFIICSQVASTCLPPYKWETTFNDQYDCLTFGYQESLKKMEEIGREEINKHNIFVRFICSRDNQPFKSTLYTLHP